MPKQSSFSKQVAALEEAIGEDVDGTSAYLVLGDWLQTQGDPRGELIAIQHARIAKPDDASLARREHAILEAHFGQLRTLLADFTWHLGFVRSAWINAEKSVTPAAAKRQLTQFLALPVARFLRSLSVGRVTGSKMADYTLVTKVLANHELPFLGELRLGHFPNEQDWKVKWGTIGDLTDVLRACPNLERLSLRGDFRLGKPVLRQLRRLVIESDGSPAEICRSLDAAVFPKLERLTVTLSPSDDIPELNTVLDGRFPNLQVLELKFWDPTKQQLELLSHGKTLPKLKRLTLEWAALTDRKAAVISAAAARYRHLEWLSVDNNVMTGPTLSSLAQLCKRVFVGTQHPHNPAFEWDWRRPG